MAIDKNQESAKPGKMLQIQSAQKVINSSIFDVSKNNKESSSTIHSGQFMVSRLHEEKDEDDDEEGPIFSDDSKDFSAASMGYDFVKATKETSQTYHFGPKSTSTLSIDASLTKLFECMTLAYSGKITSPKWKPFRGMHLSIKDKVRLNNIIWREWHMQYIFQMKPMVCQFATPLSDYIHSKPEAVVLEGKYWKRRLDTVTKEYKRWRRFYRDRILQSIPEASLYSPAMEVLTERELLERVKEVDSSMPRSMQPESSTDLSILNADLMDVDFSDNFFSALNQPFPFPNPRDFNQLMCADLIQPGLVQLQPNLEDFMDIEQELMVPNRPVSSNMFLPTSMPSPPVADILTSMDLSQQHQLFQNTGTLGQLEPVIFSAGNNNNNNTASMTMLSALAALSSSNNNASNSNNNNSNTLGATATATAAPSPAVLNTSNSLFSTDTQMIVDDGGGASSGKQTFGLAAGGQQQQQQQGSGFLQTLFGLDLGGGGLKFGTPTTPTPTPAPPTLTLQSSTLPQQHIFGGPSVVGGVRQTVELQQILSSPQQALGSQQQQQQQTILTQQMIDAQQTLGSSQQRVVVGAQQQQQQQQQQVVAGSGLVAGSGSMPSQHSHLVVGGGGGGGGGGRQAAAVGHGVVRQKRVAMVPQQTPTPAPAPAPAPTPQQQAVVSPQTMPTVNLAALGLTPSPSLSPSSSSSAATLGFPLAVSMPTAASVQPGAVAVSSSSVTASAGSPARTVRGRGGGGAKVGGQKAAAASSSSQHAVTSGRTHSGHGAAGVKKDVLFAVPQGKPVTTPRKPRTIAPAPSPPRSVAPSTPTPSMQSTYLAQLLREGTYPGAVIKKEPTATQQSTVVTLPAASLAPLLSSLPVSSTPSPAPHQAPSAPAPAPAPTPASTLTFTAAAAQSPVSSATLKLPSDLMEISKVSGVDFATSVLLAAASSAIGTTPSSLKDVLRLNPSNVATASMTSEMSTTPAASPSPRSPMQVALSPSPGPSATPPPSSPLAVVFSEALSPIASPSSHSLSFQQTSPSSSRDEGAGGGMRVGIHTEQRRVAHLSAEQKRRGNLKTGFDLLHTLVPSLAQNPKVSKATMLQKTAEHCRKMKAERAQMQHEASILKQEIESLNSAITNVQAQLPETGVPVTRQRVDHMKDMFEEYVRSRTIQNWKFWIFSIIIRSLFDSYNSMVSTSSVEELCRTVAAWLDQHCSLVSLRPTVLNALRHLSMTTSILTEPGRVKEQATQAVTKGGKAGDNLLRH
ncbi:MLX-interacting protein-like isoform X2 [Babylonia areolata]|uniref:MLX-interacting protein-like isoform X2 n=1 Tax=Babylonia areolata TaxID=304850 RepID=UPI003FCF87CE